ncbi:MAG TPA: PEP-CTERM sorting domain-containing protein [Gemmatimonadaceae bacterium]|nr:PEP-CTERM sorting domain-containing protein [Gemmatimonadaceae bacterium]
MPALRHASRLWTATLAASLLVASSAEAQTPLVDGAWTTFSFGGVGAGASGQPFTYTASSRFFVTVLDGFSSGDQFQLLDGATPIGTSTAPTDGSYCSSPAECLASSAFSRGTFLLDPGTYSFNVNVTASPFGSGGAYIGINVSDALASTATSTVPEPATAALTAAGLLAMAGVSTRRRRAR